MAIMVVTGILMVEISLHRFRKIPFACSYLPGKAKIHTKLGTVGIGFLLAASLGVQIEFWAMHKNTRFAVLFAILLVSAVLAWRRTAEFARSPANLLQFEDLPPAEVTALDLRSDGEWSREEAYVDAFDPHA
jgi:cobalamin biosynthesis protein CobD/CbiB